MEELELLKKLVEEGRARAREGAVATYIPELARANPENVAIGVARLDGSVVTAGDASVRFTMQSISKVLSLMLAMVSHGDDVVFAHVGKEPTGDPFNSIVRLETWNGKKPLNPMINAGAIAVSSLLPGRTPGERERELLAFVRRITGSDKVSINQAVYESERRTSTRNRALAWFLKDLGIIQGEVEEILDIYFRQCALEVNTEELARIGAFLAWDGIVPGTERRIIPVATAKTVKSLMMTCGLYDGSGEFAVSVGIPAKSGVGGGIMAAVPGRFGIGVHAPALDSRGNSVAGIHMLERLSHELELSIL